MLEKLNMVIGAFFSEVGTELLTEISKFDSKSSKTSKILVINSRWAEQDFDHAKKNINSMTYHLKSAEKILIPSNFCKDPRCSLKKKECSCLHFLKIQTFLNMNHSQIC